MSDGRRLLELFREKQGETLGDGCKCRGCERAMEHAYKKFKEDLDG